MNARLYARYSVEGQSETSIADQLRVGRAYAQRHGWPIASEHSDEGISGAAIGNRPGVRAALAACQRGDILLVNDLSRLARSQDLAPLVTRLRHRGVRVIGVQDGFDSESRTARMQAGLSGIMSEEFRAMVADRTRSALELRAREGRATGGKAYENADVVREIFARFAAGESMKAIASDLNRRGEPSPGATWKPRSGVRGRWLVSALHALLHNERYVGRLVWNRSQWVKDPDTGRRIRRERPASEHIVRECTPLIDADTWARAQARFRAARKGRGRTSRYLLSGILDCALCGAKLIVVGGTQRRYACSQHHHGGPHACPNDATFPRVIAEDMLLRCVMDEMLSPQREAEGVRMLREERMTAERVTNAPDADVVQLERLVREGMLSAELAEPALVEARRKAAARRQPVALPWPSVQVWRATVRSMREVLQGDDAIAARGILKELIGAVPCRPDDSGDYVIAEIRRRPVLLATGTGSGIWDGSGGPLRTYIPRRIGRGRAT